MRPTNPPPGTRAEAAAILAGIASSVKPETEIAVLDRRMALLQRWPAEGEQPPMQAPARMSVASFCQLRGFGAFNASLGWPGTEVLRSLAATGANHARCWHSAKWDGNQYHIDKPQRGAMAQGLQQAAELGLSIVLALSIAREDMPWGSAAKTAAYVAMVAEIVSFYRDAPALVAVDLMNEPVTVDLPAGGAWTAEQFATVGRDWRELATACAHVVQAVAPGLLVVYQVGLGADPGNFEEAVPIELPWVIHTAHVYHPHSFTHQGVPELSQGQQPAAWVPYSSADRATLRASLERMARWSDRHNRPIYFGESGAMSYAPGVEQYVRDVTQFAAARGWPMEFHEWRGWEPWHPNPATLEVLRAFFGRR